MKRLLVATSNRGKLKELVALLDGVALETLADHPGLTLPEETGETFAENAQLKSEAACFALGLPSLADDSGLVVDALDGAPGVHSARYAPGSDADRVQKLLSALTNVPDAARTARFVCALAFSVPGQPTIFVEGRVEGRIAHTPRGTGGFGYDPIFLVAEGFDRTMAELDAAEKNRISHRGRAISALGERLRRHFSLEPF